MNVRNYKVISSNKHFSFSEYFDQFSEDPNYSEIKQACQIFFYSTPEESIKQIDTIINAIENSSEHLKMHLHSLDFISRLLYLQDQLSSQDFSIALQLINTILSENPDDREYNMLKICNSFLNTLNTNHLCLNESLLQDVHYLFNCFSKLFCRENINCFNESFFTKIVSFNGYNKQIDIDISEIFESSSRYIPIDRDHRYFFGLLEYLFQTKTTFKSLFLIQALKNILQRNPSLGFTQNSWVFGAISDCCCSSNNETVKISFELCQLLHSNIEKILTKKNVKNMIFLILNQKDINDIRLIPTIQALAYFMKVDPNSFFKKFQNPRKSKDLIINLINIIRFGTFNTKVDACFLFAFIMEKLPFLFMVGIMPQYNGIYDTNYDQALEAVFSILEMDNYDLIFSILKGLGALCAECTSKGLLSEYRDELCKYDIIERIQFFHLNDDGKVGKEAENLLECLEIYSTSNNDE